MTHGTSAGVVVAAFLATACGARSNPATDGAAADRSCRGLADLCWLEGYWLEPGGDGPRRAEVWCRTGPLTLIGVGGTPDAWDESLGLRVRHGAVVYEAEPRAQPPVAFPLARRADASQWTFENAGNEWPTRLIYERLWDRRLRVTATGPGRTVTWTFERVDRPLPPSLCCPRGPSP